MRRYPTRPVGDFRHLSSPLFSDFKSHQKTCPKYRDRTNESAFSQSSERFLQLQAVS